MDKIEWHAHIGTHDYESAAYFHLTQLDSITGKRRSVTFQFHEWRGDNEMTPPEQVASKSPFRLEPRTSETGELVQAIIDAAWQAGFRPRQFQPPENKIGELAAMEAHLVDMRAIVFKKLGFKEPPK